MGQEVCVLVPVVRVDLGAWLEEGLDEEREELGYPNQLYRGWVGIAVHLVELGRKWNTEDCVYMGLSSVLLLRAKLLTIVILKEKSPSFKKYTSQKMQLPIVNH